MSRKYCEKLFAEKLTIFLKIVTFISLGKNDWTPFEFQKLGRIQGPLSNLNFETRHRGRLGAELMTTERDEDCMPCIGRRAGPNESEETNAEWRLLCHPLSTCHPRSDSSADLACAALRATQRTKWRLQLHTRKFFTNNQTVFITVLPEIRLNAWLLRYARSPTQYKSLKSYRRKVKRWNYGIKWAQWRNFGVKSGWPSKISDFVYL